MILAKEENIVKEWCYAVSSKGSKETKHILTVTNKRIISESTSSNRVTREELPVNLVKGISSSTEKSSKLIPILFFICGALSLIMAIALFKASILFSLIGGVFTFLFIYLGVNKLKQGSFTLTFHTYERNNGECLCVGSSNLSTHALPIFKLFLNKKLSIVVNNEVSQDIIDSIGAIIIDCQDEIYNKAKTTND